MKQRRLSPNDGGNGITEGVIWKQLAEFALPLMLGNLFQQMYNTVDSEVVGNYVSKEALAAVALWVYEINKPEPIVEVQVTDVANMDADEAESALIKVQMRCYLRMCCRREGQRGGARTGCNADIMNPKPHQFFD